MIKRDKYTKKIHGLSTQNEPVTDLILSGNVRQYPDIYYAYKRFGDYFNLDNNQFFLGNGCENTIKNVLLALKPKSLTWSSPTWRMIEIYCEALNIKPINYQYKYDVINHMFTESKDVYLEKSDVFYHNAGITTCFTYDWSIDELYNTKSTWNVVDLTYKNMYELKQLIPELLKNEKNIIVGSFDKLFGCGLRLGFAIYPKKLHHQMSLQREQHINLLAYNWLLETDFKFVESEFKSKLMELISQFDYITDNFITIVGDVDTSLPCHKFVVSGKKFTRFGIPNNKTEFDALKIVLLDFINNRHHNGI